MLNVEKVDGGKFAQLGDDLAVFLSDEDSLPPTVCPELVPAGWRVAEDQDFINVDFTNGDWVEVYILERIA